tara:strand:+ start:81 stop:275 length:195 start_codon:yes stop_codon:yes gene_type:complete
MVTTRNQGTAIRLIIAFVEDGQAFTYRRIAGRHILDDANPTSGEKVAEILSEILPGESTGANEA